MRVDANGLGFAAGRPERGNSPALPTAAACLWFVALSSTVTVGLLTTSGDSAAYRLAWFRYLAEGGDHEKACAVFETLSPRVSDVYTHGLAVNAYLRRAGLTSDAFAASADQELAGHEVMRRLVQFLAHSSGESRTCLRKAAALCSSELFHRFPTARVAVVLNSLLDVLAFPEPGASAVVGMDSNAASRLLDTLRRMAHVHPNDPASAIKAAILFRRVITAVDELPGSLTDRVSQVLERATRNSDTGRDGG